MPCQKHRHTLLLNKCLALLVSQSKLCSLYIVDSCITRETFLHRKIKGALMFHSQETAVKSRLGTLLVQKKLINKLQLQEALHIQTRDNKRLGEVLLDQKFITPKQLKKSLKRQSRHRYIAAAMAMVLGLFQPISANAISGQDTLTNTSKEQMLSASNMEPLDNNALGSIVAQGINEETQSLISNLLNSGEGDGSELNNLAAITFPILNFIDADIQLHGVEYAQDRDRKIITSDGAIDLQLPVKIAEMTFKNIRIKGTGNSMGDITVSNIQFGEGSSLKIRLN